MLFISSTPRRRRSRTSGEAGDERGKGRPGKHGPAPPDRGLDVRDGQIDKTQAYIYWTKWIAAAEVASVSDVRIALKAEEYDVVALGTSASLSVWGLTLALERIPAR